MKYSHDDKVVFIQASLCAVMDVSNRDNRTQKFFRKHDDDVVSLAIHPRRNIAASGQKSTKSPYDLVPIYVWDIETLEILAVLQGFHQGAAYILKFSPDGSKLLSIGKDSDHSMAIYDWANEKMIVSSKVDKHFVTDATFKTDNELITVGTRHIKFWTIRGNNINFRLGNWGATTREAFVSVVVCFPQNVCFTGSVSGKIYTWQTFGITKVFDAHNSCIRVLLEHNNTLYSGGDDGEVKKWSYAGRLQKHEENLFNIEKDSPETQLPKDIRSIDISSDGILLVATHSSTVYQVDSSESSKPPFKILDGHFKGELWGLAVNPKNSQFVTVGDDRTIRKWDTSSKDMIEL